MWIALVLLVLLVAAGLLGWRRLRPRPLYKLTLREGSGAGLDFIIREATARIGSAEGQTVVVSHPKVSREHAVLEMREDGRFVLRGLSRYGTRVNGELAEEAELRSGDLIRLGDSVDLIFTRF